VKNLGKACELEQKHLGQNSCLVYFPSFLNHSCICNTFANYVGDCSFQFANRDIKKDEEIFTKYFAGTFKERAATAKSAYDFKCDCKLCKLDEMDNNLEEREALVNIINEKEMSDVTVEIAIRDVELMRETYGNRTELQIDLVAPLEILASKYREENNFEKSAKTFEEIYHILKETALTQHSIASLKVYI
jgi:hypothetical protein